MQFERDLHWQILFGKSLLLYRRFRLYDVGVAHSFLETTPGDTG